MTAIQQSITRLDRAVAPTAPARRLAILRVIVATFGIAYLLIRLPVFIGLADNRPTRFDPVGPLSMLSSPLPNWMLYALIASAIGSAAGVLIGYRYRIVGPVFATSVVLLLTYRSSWGQILWFEVVFVLHALIIGVSPAADVLSLDERRRVRPPAPHQRYGWPVKLAAIVTVTTYFVSAIAKLRIGGVDWVAGDSLRNHIAFSAARLDVFGATSSPLADSFVARSWLAPIMAATALVLELVAPLALLGGRLRTWWVVATWSMHLLIAATMFIVFPYPLFAVAFAPLFALEQLHKPKVLQTVGDD